MKTFIWCNETNIFAANTSDIYTARTLLLNNTIEGYRKRVAEFRENILNGTCNPITNVDFEEHFLRDMVKEQQVFMSNDADKIIEEGETVIFKYINFNE